MWEWRVVTDLTERSFGLVMSTLNTESFLSLHETFLDD